MKLLFSLLILTVCSGCVMVPYRYVPIENNRHRWYYKEMTTPHTHDFYEPRKARKVYYYE